MKPKIELSENPAHKDNQQPLIAEVKGNETKNQFEIFIDVLRFEHS